MARKRKQIDPIVETDKPCKTEVLEDGAMQGGKTEALKRCEPSLIMGPKQYAAVVKADAERTKKNS